MMRKDDVEFHSEGFGRDSRPAVNVKVRGIRSDYDKLLPLDLGSSYPVGHPELVEHHKSDPRFTLDWMGEHMTDEEQSSEFDFACMLGWEALQDEATEIWGPTVKVYSEGRSGGWAIVDGLPDFDSWDAIDLGRWARFEKVARLTADDIPRVMLDLIYSSSFDAWVEREDWSLRGC